MFQKQWRISRQQCQVWTRNAQIDLSFSVRRSVNGPLFVPVHGPYLHTRAPGVPLINYRYVLPQSSCFYFQLVAWPRWNRILFVSIYGGVRGILLSLFLWVRAGFINYELLFTMPQVNYWNLHSFLKTNRSLINWDVWHGNKQGQP